MTTVVTKQWSGTRKSPRQSAVHLVQSSQFAQRVARYLLVGLLLSMVSMLLLPWQQTSRGTGRVIAFAPKERQQTIQSPFKGTAIVESIAPGVVEGSKVKRGDPLLRLRPLADNEPEQLAAAKRDLEDKKKTEEAKIEVAKRNAQDFLEAQKAKVEAAEKMVKAAEAELAGKRKLVTGYEAKAKQAEQNLIRQKGLFQDGLKAEKEVEKLQAAWEFAIAELEDAKAQVTAKILEVEAKLREVDEKRSEAQTKIDKALGEEEDAKGKVFTTQKQIRELEIKLKLLQARDIDAPCDGTVFRMPVAERGSTFKEGEPILTIIPDTEKKAVELFVVGNDMPLVQEGQEVRLQFEGWPAVQFAGWPSVAVGTFSGQVTSVDAMDDGKGQFRILVLPSDGSEWPEDIYLRQGVRVNGWVMLRQVSLGYEIWRQLNGFPVILGEDAPKESKKDEKSKPPKMPK